MDTWGEVSFTVPDSAPDDTAMQKASRLPHFLLEALLCHPRIKRSGAAHNRGTQLDPDLISDMSNKLNELEKENSVCVGCKV
ncbi:hypothetical protein ElyMa_001546100 [Elysia marginata]|uniref:Uncharacterized protein n=1 Tax=Elysia marginata TaxID=1093978 RepID=A0AAV4JDL0_9GAST|nr:hypothetical protein ElyMa_001546100 [Elysia marginata]